MLRWVVGARQSARAWGGPLDVRFAQECNAAEVSWPAGADRMHPALAVTGSLMHHSHYIALL